MSNLFLKSNWTNDGYFQIIIIANIRNVHYIYKMASNYFNMHIIISDDIAQIHFLLWIVWHSNTEI
jgi:hypothetical protein